MMTENSLYNYLQAIGLKGEPFYSIPQLTQTLNNISQKLSKNSFLMFVAQSAFETQCYCKFVENLYYTSAERIKSVWPSRFYVGTPISGKRNANLYIKNPQKLANFVYANRGGNGSEESGDGFRYRGRGAFHLTFKNNYLNASMSLYQDNRLEIEPELVEECFYAFDTALWFWNYNNLSQYENNIIEITKKINGSASSTNNRLIYWNKAKELLG